MAQLAKTLSARRNWHNRHRRQGRGTIGTHAAPLRQLCCVFGVCPNRTNCAMSLASVPCRGRIYNKYPNGTCAAAKIVCGKFAVATVLMSATKGCRCQECLCQLCRVVVVCNTYPNDTCASAKIVCATCVVPLSSLTSTYPNGMCEMRGAGLRPWDEKTLVFEKASGSFFSRRDRKSRSNL